MARLLEVGDLAVLSDDLDRTDDVAIELVQLVRGIPTKIGSPSSRGGKARQPPAAIRSRSDWPTGRHRMRVFRVMRAERE